MSDIYEQITRCGIVPVVVLDSIEDAVPTAEAFLKGGINVMEITLRTPAAAGAIREVSEKVPEIIVGAGTVITPEQCREAISCGARFIVSPGFDIDVADICREAGVPLVPGCVTPTEITSAIRHGIKTLKFFPANVYGGLTAIKALAGPFASAGVKFVPTSGINMDNLAEYLSSPYIAAVGGSWVCPRSEIRAGNFDKITGLCRDAVNIAESIERQKK